MTPAHFFSLSSSSPHSQLPSHLCVALCEEGCSALASFIACTCCLFQEAFPASQWLPSMIPHHLLQQQCWSEQSCCHLIMHCLHFDLHRSKTPGLFFYFLFKNYFLCEWYTILYTKILCTQTC